MITIKEVSELAKVSQSTVSRALNGHPTVKEKNRKKVFDAIEQLGYQPNAFAQALASNRSNSIGMLVGTLSGPFYGPLMHHAEKVVRARNNHLIITSGQEQHSEELESIRFLRAKKVDGLIIHADTLSDSELISLVQQQPATVILNRYIPEIAEHCAYLDNELGGYLATQHLIESGHRHIACITGQLSKCDSRERLQGYRNALSDAAIDYDANLVVEGRFDDQGNHQAARRLLDRDPKIKAVFCQNDAIALALYDVAMERSLRIGHDIAVVGFDNDSLSEHLRPQLSSVNFPISEMGRIAAERVMALIDGQKVDQLPALQLTPELIVRASSTS
ncbi:MULTISPECIES: LacI family DNA-binding transcriptional regulator [Aliagarivorans]|uniref:LacI family DNA-binding transcriptional regulator n=1 Tax=Aliagarivorans TaxID=882379 RepID=UPI00040BF3A9|nr:MULTISPECIES: LacI family DNA-binding transcriptional regulator [Aliagarivorans]